MGEPPSFPAMFSKRDNFRDFLFASLDDEVFLHWDYSYRNESAPMRANSFLYMRVPIYMETSMKITELLPLKVYSFTFMTWKILQNVHLP